MAPKDLLAALSYPAALIGAEGDLHLYNAAFDAIVPPRGDLHGESLFELLADFEGIDEVAHTFRELAPFEPLHHVFSLERTLQSGIPLRYRAELHVVDQGDALRYLVLLREVVDEQARQHEMETLERRLRSLRELKHDISNLLMGQIGYIDLLRDQESLSESANARADKIHELGREISGRLQRMGTILHGGENPDGEG